MYNIESKVAFVGFGEVNTPSDIIIRKCLGAVENLKSVKALNIVAEIYPVTDDIDELDIQNAINALKSKEFDVLCVCIAGWIPTHAVIKVTEYFKHIPMILWGLSSWIEGDRLVTTADQAGTSALRKIFKDLNYKFTYIYDIVGKPPDINKVADYCIAASACKKLRHAKAGMMGYRDMNLYGTLYDGTSLKQVIGTEIETFEMLEVYNKYNEITDSAKQKIIDTYINEWRFMKPAHNDSLLKAAGYYLVLKEIACTRKYDSVSLKDVDGMKKLLNYPPAPIFMLLANIDGISVVPENDSLGCVTQLIIKYLTGQCGAYLEFYEFFDDRVLAGVPDFIPQEITDGDVIVMPAAFGELSEGILNVSKVKTGLLTMCRLFYDNNKYYLHMVTGEGITPRKWEEAGWTQPAPQLPGLEIIISNVEKFTQNVMSQHYFICYGDNTSRLKYLCDILGVEII